jgi:hypothetical protein
LFEEKTIIGLLAGGSNRMACERGKEADMDVRIKAHLRTTLFTQNLGYDGKQIVRGTRVIDGVTNPEGITDPR